MRPNSSSAGLCAVTRLLLLTSILLLGAASKAQLAPPASDPVVVNGLSGDVKAGKALYNSFCIACHSVGNNGIGPAHRGVFGRKAGLAPGYDYSEAVRKSSILWTAENLNRWLTDPEKLIPGQNMNQNVPAAQDRANVIAYLATLK